MRRAGYLIERIADWDNLCLAYCKARHGKRQTDEMQAYGRNLFGNLRTLRQDILSGHVTVGKYTFFTITDPKRRKICAAAFPERVLHHALMNVCHFYFDRTMTDDTCATRLGMGEYVAVEKARKAAARYGYVAKLDVRQYFDSIRHDILKAKLRRMFKDRKLLAVLDSIIDSYSFGENIGLPKGNLTSQYFANYYLSDIDHRIKECLLVAAYVRYMDDMLVFADNHDVLREYVAGIKTFAGDLGLELKTPLIMPVVKGIPFLGYRIYPHNLALERRSKIRFARKMKHYKCLLDEGQWTEKQYAEHIVPLLAFIQKADTKRFRKGVLQRVMAEKL